MTYQCFIESLKCLQGITTIGVGFGIIWFEFNRTLITYQCFIQSFEFLQGITTIGVGISIIGFKNNRTIITCLLYTSPSPRD